MAPEQRRDIEDNFDPKMARFYEEKYVPEEDESGEEVPGQVAPDDAMERVIKELIHNSRKLDGADVSVKVYHADVTLEGTVRTEEEKLIAGSLVQLVHGAGIVKNNLVVKRNEGILPTDVGRQH